MKNTKLKSDIEGKIASKVNEIVKELKVEGHAISKSIADAQKIAKTIAKKLKEIEKKNAPAKKTEPKSTVKKATVAAAKPKAEKPTAKNVTSPIVAKTVKPLIKK